MPSCLAGAQSCSVLGSNTNGGFLEHDNGPNRVPKLRRRIARGVHLSAVGPGWLLTVAWPRCCGETGRSSWARVRRLFVWAQVPPKEGQRLRRLRGPGEPREVVVFREPAIRYLDPGRLQRGHHQPCLRSRDDVVDTLLENQEGRARRVDKGNRRVVTI